MDLILFALPLLAALSLLIWTLFKRRSSTRRQDQESSPPEKNTPIDPYQDIEPLPNFDWQTTTPLKIRPFKPKYHLTMALENCPLSELIANDNTYLDRIQHRKELMDAHPRKTYRCNPVCEEAVLELYEWMIGTYLPKRFPTMYRLVTAAETPSDLKPAGPSLQNIPANTYIPLTAPSGPSALYTLGANIDTDMLLLLPNPTAPSSPTALPIYHLQAFVTCFPSGFATQDKLGLPLSGIHKPVPGYKEKLEKSMDRFFAKLECGKAVRRCNWSVTTNDKLYSQGGNHMYEDGSTHAADPGDGPVKGAGNAKTLDTGAANLDEVIAEQKKDVRIEECRLRCERQTLHRLPKTKALVFMFKTYQYKLADVKAEGDGEALAEAIPGLREGSVPDMAFYKRQVVWGDKVVEYLRS